MFKQFWSFLAIALAISSCFSQVDCQAISGVSWVYQGTAQQNNTALTFNLYDSLNLICKASISATMVNKLIFAISKGTIPTGMSVSSGVLTITNVGTLIYSDIDGIKSGYENFIIYGTPYNSVFQPTIVADFRYINVGTLKTTDSATYVCSVGYYATASAAAPVDSVSPATLQTSGRLTITVNTKSGQAHSARTKVNRLVTYTTAIMGASKLFF